jgi:hypothetical protein
MKKVAAVLLAVSASLAPAACNEATSPSPLSAPTSQQDAKNLKTLQVFFTKVPLPRTVQNISVGTGVDLFTFTVSSTYAQSMSLTEMSWMVYGSLVDTDLTNFQLVYFADGLANPGVVVATSNTFVPGPTVSLHMRLSSPIPLDSKNKERTIGTFVLRADVNTPGVMINFRLSTAAVNELGVEHLLFEGTCDLPLDGDEFHTI